MMSCRQSHPERLTPGKVSIYSPGSTSSGTPQACISSPLTGPDGGGKSVCTHGHTASNGVGSCLQRQCLWVNCHLQAPAGRKDSFLSRFKNMFYLHK